jgi:DNA-binding response OmpR family regulator
LKPRLLIFEDNDDLLSTLKIILNESGYEVHTFSNPAMYPLYYPSDHDCLLEEPCSDIIISDCQGQPENVFYWAV